MGRNACVFVGESKGKWRGGQEEEEERSKEGGVSAKAAAWLSVWMKEPLTLIFSCCLSSVWLLSTAANESRDSPRDFKLDVNIFQKLWPKVQHFWLLFVRLVTLSKKISSLFNSFLVWKQTYFWEPVKQWMVSFSDGKVISFRKICCGLQVILQMWLCERIFGILVVQTFRAVLKVSWTK